MGVLENNLLVKSSAVSQLLAHFADPRSGLSVTNTSFIS